MKKILFFGFFAVGTMAFAKNAIGPAGCGLGNIVFGKESQVLAATTNGSSGSQTFGITSGTSNCVDSAGHAKLETFIEVNQVALAKDISRGEGETLNGLTTLMSCKNSTETKDVLRKNYSEIFPNGNDHPQEVKARIKSVLHNHHLSCDV